MQTIEQQTFCGRTFTGEEILLIQEVVDTCAGISRRELAHTVCELLEWKRLNDRLKARECGDLLGLLEFRGVLTLPDKQQRKRSRPQKIVPADRCSQPHSTLRGRVESFTPLEIQRVQDQGQRDLFKELIGRHHYLGYAMQIVLYPFQQRFPVLISPVEGIGKSF